MGRGEIDLRLLSTIFSKLFSDTSTKEIQVKIFRRNYTGHGIFSDFVVDVDLGDDAISKVRSLARSVILEDPRFGKYYGVEVFPPDKPNHRADEFWTLEIFSFGDSGFPVDYLNIDFRIIE